MFDNNRQITFTLYCTISHGDKMNNKDTVNKLLHEIKNPLAVCNGYLEMIPNVEEKQKDKYFKIIKSEIERSLSIISDYSKNKLLEIEKEELDLTMLYEDIKDTLNSLFTGNNSEIILLDNDELYLQGDYNKLKQVFINILKNAYEAKNDNKLLVVIKTLITKDDYQISIIDNGIGMTHDELETIGEEYFTTKTYGTGLGVSYIKKIIKLHGGKIVYRSRKNIGTEVLISLPKEKSQKTF